MRIGRRRHEPGNEARESATRLIPGTGPTVVTGRGTPLFPRPDAGLLAGVRRFEVPPQVLADTIETLASAGRKNAEAFVVWGGVVEGDLMSFRSAIVPAQRAQTTKHGLLVSVDGRALFEVNRSLYSRGEILGGQVHTHPTDAYHSDTDDHFPLATTLGALSVVVPDFARHGIGALNRWAFYRLAGPDVWNALAGDERVELLA